MRKIIRNYAWFCLVQITLICCARAQTCSSFQAAIDPAKTKVQRDQNAIRDLGFNIEAGELDSLGAASAQERELMVKTAYKNLIGSALDLIGESAGGALDNPTTLPHGFASLNPINVNTYINRLPDRNGPIAWLLKQIAATSNKSTKLKLLAELPKAVSKEEAEYDVLFGDASRMPHSFEDYIGLTKDLADLAGFSQASKTLQIGNSLANTVVAYANLIYGGREIEKLNQMTTLKAQTLAKWDSTMKADVGRLSFAKQQYADCQKAAEYESERQSYVAALHAADAAHSSCLDKIPVCFDSCVAGGDTSTSGKWLAREVQCQQQCGSCKAEEAAADKAQQELSDFEQANNYGHPTEKKQ